MALDGIVTRAIVHELQSCRGARINKIYQPNDRDIVFHIRTQQGNAKLLLSANPTYPRVHLTQETFLNPAEAPMFSNESVLHIRWSKYWSFSFSISPSNEYSGFFFL